MNERYPLPYAYGESYTQVEAGGACAALINVALVGAVVGGSAAAASNARRMRRNEIEFADALLSTGRSAVASAAATALAGATASAVADQGALRLSIMFGVGAALLYGLNRWVAGEGKTDA